MAFRIALFKNRIHLSIYQTFWTTCNTSNNALNEQPQANFEI